MDVLRLVCSDGSVLGITELQPPGNKHSIIKTFFHVLVILRAGFALLDSGSFCVLV